MLEFMLTVFTCSLGVIAGRSDLPWEIKGFLLLLALKVELQVVCAIFFLNYVVQRISRVSDVGGRKCIVVVNLYSNGSRGALMLFSSMVMGKYSQISR